MILGYTVVLSTLLLLVATRSSGIMIVTCCTKSGFLVRTGMYQPVPSTYWYVMLKMVHTVVPVCTGMSVYSVCTGITSMTCMIAMKSGTVLVFKHHHVLELETVPYAQYLFPLSKVKT